MGMPLVTLCVTLGDALRPGLHSHAERGNDQGRYKKMWEQTLCGSWLASFHIKSAPTFCSASLIGTTTHSTSRSSRGSHASA
ncbi:hypothetical protein DJ480_04285 [Pseudomonas sp. Leaf98]|nr:hypothetical protein DJ480_04285 [Pseudomonas sp. Leaf98]